ncbi:MAG: amidase [Candidatus Cloacimonadaceae bacterium]|nr:amidase [Candidatus Cloacimonadaceae bacterium]
MPPDILLQRVEEICRLLEQRDSLINAFLPETGRRERLKKQAQQLIDRYPAQKPLLYGLLAGIKDIYNVEGMPTRAGSQLPEEAFIGEESSLVTMLKALGVLIVGKTVSTEFAYFQPGETRNPIDPNHSPGGSSSGSAAAVAAGFCDFSIGTQTIASVIRPAAYCGIVGFKPSYGIFPLDGVLPFSQSADHPGFFSLSIDAMIRIMKALLPGWKDEETDEPTLGIPSEYFLGQANAEARAAFQESRNKLVSSGCREIETTVFEDIESINKLHQDLIAREFYLNHEQLYSSYGSLYSQPSKDLFHKGKAIPDYRADQARTEQKRIRQQVSETMRDTGIKLWISPSTTSAAPRGLESTGSPLMSLPFTFCGLPSITIPHGKSAHGLPFGIQISAEFLKDHYLLNAAKHITNKLFTG